MDVNNYLSTGIGVRRLGVPYQLQNPIHGYHPKRKEKKEKKCKPSNSWITSTQHCRTATNQFLQRTRSTKEYVK